MKMKKNPKLLYYSNSPVANSGYSKQTRYIVQGLMQSGYQTDIQPNYGFGAGTMTIKGSKYWPQGSGRSEGEAIAAYAKGNYDMLITLYDAWVLHVLVEEVKKKGIVWIPYVPLDFLYLPHDLGSKLQAATHILPMTQYGLDMLKRVGFQNVDRYLHHGVDTNEYKVMNEMPKQEMRDDLGFRGKSFIISIFKMNKGDRVKYGENLEAIKIFLSRNPDLANEVGVYIHAQPNAHGGQPLIQVAKALGLENIVRFVDSYTYMCGYTEEEMARAYNGTDVTLNNTSSGGFEIPIIESLACGTPVIATDGMAMHELLKPVLPELLSPPKTDYWTPLSSKVMQPDPEAIADRIEWVLNHDMEKQRKRLADHAKKMWSWDVIIPKWVEYIEFLEEFIDKKCIHVPALPSEYMRRLSRQGVTI